MDSKEILSIFFIFFSFLHGSHARAPIFGSLLSSPSPSSSPSPAPEPAPAPGPSNEGCWLQRSKSCRNGSLTACIDASSAASKESLLFVKNDGEGPLTLNVTVSHAEHIIQDMPIPAHQEVNISVNLGGNSSILLDAGNLKCVIQIRSAASGDGGISDHIPFPSRMTPMNVAYFLFLTGLIFGSTWACCKRGERGRRVDGVPYQELEMGQQPDSPSANNVETAEGWEQDWDGNWDELKSKAGNGPANGLTSRPPKRDGRENTFDD